MVNSSINFQLACEMQRINDSLRNISSILDSSDGMMHVNQLGMPPRGSMMSGTGSKIEASFDSQSPLTRQLNTARNPIQIENRVNEQLGQSIGLWNNMMA